MKQTKREAQKNTAKSSRTETKFLYTELSCTNTKSKEWKSFDFFCYLIPKSETASRYEINFDSPGEPSKQINYQ